MIIRFLKILAVAATAMSNDIKLHIITYLRISINILFINTDACKMSTITMLARTTLPVRLC